MSSPFIGAAWRSLEPKSLQHAIRARSRPQFAPPHIEPLARPDGTETERRLERELSQILSRPPVRRRHGHLDKLELLYEIEPDEPPATMLFVGPHFHDQAATEPSVYLSNSRDADAGDASGGDHEDAYGNQPLHGTEIDPRNTNWLKTARRARRNRTLRLAASWAITISVGLFIILMAAAILFGLPDGRFALHEQAVLAATREFGTGAANPEPSVTRWRLDKR